MFPDTPMYFPFQLSLWINEKMLTAQDMSYDEARNLHSKWLKHQAFMAELASNKEWLEKIEKVSKEHPKNALIFVQGGCAQRWDLHLYRTGP